jgi:hypothetical protein
LERARHLGDTLLALGPAGVLLVEAVTKVAAEDGLSVGR